MVITASGTLSDAERQPFLGVASRCPVHKLMAQVRLEIVTAWK